MNKWTRSQLATGVALALFLTAAVDSAKGVTISGTIRDLDGNPVAAVTVKVVTDPNTTVSVVTNNDGVYTATVASNWSGTVTPTDVNFVFDPPSRTYSGITADQLAQDYTALQAIISISGYVRTGDGDAIAGVVMSGLPGYVSTDAQGRYQSFVLRDWSGTVTPTKTNYTFQPPSVTYTSVTADIAADYVGTAGQGDCNCDGVVNFADINPFVLALHGHAAYEAAYPNCVWLSADCNGDGYVNFADINPFVAILAGS